MLGSGRVLPRPATAGKMTSGWWTGGTGALNWCSNTSVSLLGSRAKMLTQSMRLVITQPSQPLYFYFFRIRRLEQHGRHTPGMLLSHTTQGDQNRVSGYSLTLTAPHLHM